MQRDTSRRYSRFRGPLRLKRDVTFSPMNLHFLAAITRKFELYSNNELLKTLDIETWSIHILIIGSTKRLINIDFTSN